MIEINYEELERLIIEQGILACMLYESSNTKPFLQVKRSQA